MARPRNIPHARLQARYYLDAKVAQACDTSPWAEVLFTRLMSVVKDIQTDGFFTAGDVITANVPKWQTHLETLIRVGLVARVDDGWVLTAWVKHNDTIERINAQYRREAERKATPKPRGKPVDNPPDNPSVSGEFPPGNPPGFRDVSGCLNTDILNINNLPPTNVGCSDPLPGGRDFSPRVSAAVDLAARRELADVQRRADLGQAAKVAHPNGWLAAKRAAIAADLGPALAVIAADLADEHPDAARLLAEHDRRQRVDAGRAGAESWGQTRAAGGMPRADVTTQAATTWPAMPELAAAALAAYDAASGPELVQDRPDHGSMTSHPRPALQAVK